MGTWKSFFPIPPKFYEALCFNGYQIQIKWHNLLKKYWQKSIDEGLLTWVILFLNLKGGKFELTNLLSHPRIIVEFSLSQDHFTILEMFAFWNSTVSAFCCFFFLSNRWIFSRGEVNSLTVVFISPPYLDEVNTHHVENTRDANATPSSLLTFFYLNFHQVWSVYVELVCH